MKKSAACFLVIFAILLSTTAALAGSISGTVTGPDGETPLAGIEVSLFVWNGEYGWDWISGEFTDDIGQYEISDLEAGAYRIGFRDDSGNYLAEVYDNALDLDMGADVAVAAEGVTDGINASLAAAAKITGTVTGPDGTTTLEGIQVVAYSWNSEDQWWDWIQSANTDAAGEYEIGGLAAGIYRVQFYGSGYYQGQVFSGSANLDEGQDIAVPAATTVANINASLAAAGRIAGTVTGPDETTGLQGVYVGCYFRNGSYWGEIAYSYTDEDGHYEIGSLAAGTYRVVFRDWSYTYLSETYNNVSGTDPSNGTDIVVVLGETTAGIGASLTEVAKITGTVTGPGGITVLEGIHVGAYTWNSADQYWDWIASADTAADGRYEISGLAAGTYRVQFSGNGDYLGEVYNDAADLDAGQDISVPAAATVENIDVSLALASKISGLVTGPDGTTALEGIYVSWYRPSDSIGGSGEYTDANGQYELGGLAAGEYRVRFEDSDGTYMSEVYDDIPGDDIWSFGTLIDVADETTTPDINASLATAGKITGTVTGPDGETPLEGIYVSWYRPSDSTGGSGEYTDANGQYEFGGLAAGEYRVRFEDSDGMYVSEVYDDIPGDGIWSFGTLIDVAAGATTPDINASLVAAGKIAGTVTGMDGTTGLQNIYARSHLWNGSYWAVMAGDYTDEDGRYEIGSLAAGTYRVVFYDWNGGYLSETYDDVPGTEPANGTDVVVVAGETTGGIDAELEQYASLSGMIESAAGGTPLSGVYVRLLGTANGENIRTRTTADGSYSFQSVHPGEYVVRAEPVRASAHLGQWYEGILYVPGQDEIPAEAQRIVLANEDVRTGIDFALDPAGRIAGTLTGEGVPIAAGRLRAENGTYGQAYWAWSDDVGSFEFVDLLPGTYTLKAEAAAYRDEWWSEAVHESEAVPFDVASGDDLVRDFDLAPGQSSARVEVTSDPSGAAIFVNFQATTSTTPAVIDVGELGVALPGGFVPAPHVFAVRKNGHPRAAPQSLTAIEAETVEVHFDLTAEDAGSLAIQTDPAGAAVYVDYAGSGEGTTPVEVANLAPGSHVILLKADGYLQAKPVVAWVENGSNTAVSVPLAPIYSADRIQAEIQSAPTGAVIYVDYLPTPDVTDAVVDWMDPASHAGSGWHSASHAVMLRKQWHVPAAAYYVPDQVNVGQTHRVELIEDLAAALDEDDDGMPDQLEAPYQDLEGWGSQGPNDDYDGDGVSNLGEMIAGTRADDPDSVLEISATDAAVSGASITLTFHSVPGNRYFIRGASALAGEPEWINLGGVVLASETETTLTVPLPEGMDIRFVQLVVWAP